MDFTPIYVNASYATCADRDVKGLYAKAAAGQVQQFTGKDSAFEEPTSDAADWIVDTEAHSAQSALKLYTKKCYPSFGLIGQAINFSVKNHAQRLYHHALKTARI